MATDWFEHLTRVPLFAGFDRNDLGHVDRIATVLEISRGKVIMREGESAHEFVIVLDGTLEVTRRGEHVADIGSGGFVGEAGLLLATQRNSTVSAKTDTTLLHVDGRGFATLLDEVPQLAVKMLPVIAARAATADDHTS